MAVRQSGMAHCRTGDLDGRRKSDLIWRNDASERNRALADERPCHQTIRRWRYAQSGMAHAGPAISTATAGAI